MRASQDSRGRSGQRKRAVPFRVPGRQSLAMTRRVALAATLVAAFGAAPGAQAWQDSSVAVAAGADRDYVIRKFGERGTAAKPESFVFAQGKYFGGFLRDPSLEHTRFMEIAANLAPDLAKQRYFPASAGRNPDLLIVVHWGITGIEEDPGHGQTDFAKLQKDGAAYNSKFSSGAGGSSKGGIGDAGYVTADLAIAYGQKAATGSAPAENAQLLGFDAELQKEEYRSLGVVTGITEMDRRLREDIADERYFVILMAYDFQSVKDGTKGVKPKLLWSIHFSVRATGFNFTNALPAMGKVAANYFGHQVDGLLLDAQKVPEGRVDVGVPRTVEDKKSN